jgi:hypothetical protein
MVRVAGTVLRRIGIGAGEIKSMKKNMGGVYMILMGLFVSAVGIVLIPHEQVTASLIFIGGVSFICAYLHDVRNNTK